MPPNNLHNFCEGTPSVAGLNEIIINAPALAEETDACGRTPLHRICRNKHLTLDMIKVYLTYAAPGVAEMADEDGRNALHHLCENEVVTPEMVKVYREHAPAAAEKEDEDGATPLDILAQNKTYKLASEKAAASSTEQGFEEKTEYSLKAARDLKKEEEPIAITFTAVPKTPAQIRAAAAAAAAARNAAAAEAETARRSAHMRKSAKQVAAAQHAKDARQHAMEAKEWAPKRVVAVADDESSFLDPYWFPTRTTRKYAEDAQAHADDATDYAEKALNVLLASKEERVGSRVEDEARSTAAEAQLDSLVAKAKACADKAAGVLETIRDAPEITITELMHPMEVAQDPAGRSSEAARRTADGAAEAAKLAEESAKAAAAIAAEGARRAIEDAAEGSTQHIRLGGN